LEEERLGLGCLTESRTNRSFGYTPTYKQSPPSNENPKTFLEECPSEWTACQEDPACEACIAGIDTTCFDDDDETQLVTCAENGEDLCCMYGGMNGCSDNPLLVAYASES